VVNRTVNKNQKTNHQTSPENPRKQDRISYSLTGSIYVQKVSSLAPVPQFPFTNMEVIDITSCNVLRGEHMSYYKADRSSHKRYY